MVFLELEQEVRKPKGSPPESWGSVHRQAIFMTFRLSVPLSRLVPSIWRLREREPGRERNRRRALRERALQFWRHLGCSYLMATRVGVLPLGEAL